MPDTISDFTGTSGGQVFERRYACVACALVFKESEMVLFRGKRYGKPCGCSKDIAQLSQRGAK